MTPEQERDYLTSKGWEMPMSEEDGCETWRLPHNLRTDYPQQLVSRTQHYWDREDAVTLQLLMDRIGKKTIREEYVEISRQLREFDASYRNDRKIMTDKLAVLQQRCTHPDATTWIAGMECQDCGFSKDI